MVQPPRERDPRATKVMVSDEVLTVELADGRVLEAPLEWFPWLIEAPAHAVENFEIIDEGRRIEWSELGEGVSLSGLFRGIAALDTE